MPAPPNSVSIISKAAFVFLAAGVACIGLFLAAAIDARVTSHAAENAFNEYRRLLVEQGPDQALWSPAQRERYQQSLSKYLIAPPAMMRIPAVGVSVPVYGGATELELNRGVGWIEGTAALGSDGNVGIAGHRDSYFRPLKDLELGEVVLLDMPDATYSYRVSEISIVDPDDVHVLESSDASALTLVTCYPFYFVGDAPQRYIVRAELERRHGPMAELTDYGLAFNTEEENEE